MEMIKQHILPQLNSFTNEALISINNIFSEIQNESKTEFTEIICYIEHLLNLSFLSTNQGLTSLHIHIENEFDDTQKLLIGEFLSIKLFKYYYSIDNKLDETNLSLADFITQIEFKINSLEIRCPDGASGKNGGNRIWKNWVKEKKENRILLEFYKALNKNSSLKPKSIFNLQKNFCSSLSQKFEFRPYTKSVDNNRESYNLVNATKTLNEIDEINNQLIDELDSIILFDCERKRIMTNFSFEEINKWNKDYDTRFTKYLIVTFGKNFSSINHTRNKLELIRERFKIPTNTTYTIAKSEIDFLLKRKENGQLSLEFVGYESSSFWDTFVLETSIRELYELRSVKLMNIYAICYTDEIKNYIIDELFSEKESSELISSTTKLAIFELRDEDIEVLKAALSNTLDIIINSGIKSNVSDSLSNNPAIVLDEAIFRNQNLLSKVRNCLGFTKTTKFKTWADLTNSDLKDLVILSYRDQGRYPNYYYPSLLELDLDSECIARAILPSFLFKQYYSWSKYNLCKEYHKLLTHPIREQHFEWNTLKNKIQELKPEQKLNIDWNLENEYSNSDQRESYKIKLKGQRVRTAYGSDLFIISVDAKTVYKVVKIDYLLSLDNEDKVFIQNLDEIQQNINIYDKIVDKKQQETELEVIRKQFNLGDETAGRLWKVLLKNLAGVQGEDQLYSELKKYFQGKGIKIVSQFHFKNSWINPQSESIAPLSKRVFIELCEYLKIPKIYFIIIQRIRNSSKQSSRQSTRQMNQLLKDLFNDGCFDNDGNPKEIINNRLDYYKANHPLDDLGIDENCLADNLATLVELIKPELKPGELESIEKTNNE
ncbi:hypothetical protein GCM10022389_15880 [Flavobacterium cheonanense]|uniref:Uncharacterized protein n=1 Tax=Flavobacterium cheonanense TaxID=706183 RepID=A0ABP7VP17_9FLAO